MCNSLSAYHAHCFHQQAKMPELLVLRIRGAGAVMVLDVDSKGMFGAAPTALPEPEPETGASNQSFASFTPKKNGSNSSVVRLELLLLRVFGVAPFASVPELPAEPESEPERHKQARIPSSKSKHASLCSIYHHGCSSGQFLARQPEPCRSTESLPCRRDIQGYLMIVEIGIC